MNRKGFTLVELIISILFIGIIFTTVTAMWIVSAGIFAGTTSDTMAHNEAVAFESMLRSSALVTKEIRSKKVDKDSQEEALESSLREYLEDEGKDYIAFGFHDGYYKVAFFSEASSEGNKNLVFMTYETLNTPDQVQIGFVNVGSKSKMQYKIGKKENSSGYWVEGGIILEELEEYYNFDNQVLAQPNRELKALYDPTNQEAILFKKGQ